MKPLEEIRVTLARRLGTAPGDNRGTRRKCPECGKEIAGYSVLELHYAAHWFPGITKWLSDDDVPEPAASEWDEISRPRSSQ